MSDETKTLYDLKKCSHEFVVQKESDLTDLIKPYATQNHSGDIFDEWLGHFTDPDEAARFAALHLPDIQKVGSHTYDLTEYYIEKNTYSLDADGDIDPTDYQTEDSFSVCSFCYDWNAEFNDFRFMVCQPEIESHIKASEIALNITENLNLGYNTYTNDIVNITENTDTKGVIPLVARRFEDELQENTKLREHFCHCLSDNTLEDIQRYNDGKQEHNPGVFSRMNLCDMIFTENNLHNCLFIGADLRNADFEMANASNCCFKGANLIGSTFEGANLRNTDFSGCDISKCCFDGADLTGSIFVGARGFETASFKDAIIEKMEINSEDIAKIKSISLDSLKVENNNIQNQPRKNEVEMCSKQEVSI